MTPNELLANVISEMTPVLYLESDKLNALLTKALLKYQSEVGPTKTVSIPEDADTAAAVAKPDDFLDVSFCRDAKSKWQEVQVTESDLVVIEDEFSRPPYTIEYFINLEGLDRETGSLPSNSVSVLWDYLKALISLPNTDRARAVALATGRVDEFPPEAELKEAIKTAEEAMIERRAMLHPVVVGGLDL